MPPLLHLWIGEVFDEPHTRELLETILRAVPQGTWPP
jgi:hypothetical protein